jgi:peptide chain release factor subunit 3
VLDATDPFERDVMAPFRMPVIDKYKEMGTIVMGKSEAGLVTVGDKLLVMPNKCVRLQMLYMADVWVKLSATYGNARQDASSWHRLA